jgi:hypothetical protein
VDSAAWDTLPDRVFRSAGVLSVVSSADDDAVDELDAAGPGSDVSADATAVPVSTATPMPRAKAKPPTRPT